MLTTYPTMLKKIIKTFLTKVLRLVSTNSGGTPYEYLHEFAKKFETALLVFSGTWGNSLKKKKTLKSKISWHSPFKLSSFYRIKRVLCPKL
jgi:hypothetical protein